MSKEKKLTEEELKQAFFILRHGSSEGLSEYIKAVLAIENKYNLQKAEIERLTEENCWLSKECNKSTTECAKLQKKVDELENRFENKACCNMIENCSMIQQAVKDTAREILGDIESCIEGMLDVERYMTKNEVEYLLEYILNKNQEYDVEVDCEN